MNLQFSHRLAITGALFGTLSVLPLAAQTEPPTDTTKPGASSGVADVQKMLDAKVSPDVIKAYIETSSTAFTVTPSDLIALKDHGVTDDISMALLKHSSATANSPTVAPAPSAAPSNPIHAYVINTGRQDPESYEFFQHYYLMPRTQAYVNQTLGYPSVAYGDSFAPYYPPGIYGYGFTPGFAGNFGFAAGARNPFNVGRNLQGGFILRR